MYNLQTASPSGPLPEIESLLQGLRPTPKFRESVTAAYNHPEKGEWEKRRKFLKECKDIPPKVLLGLMRNMVRGGEPHYIFDRTNKFIKVIYPTRQLKGVSFVLPNSFLWHHSMFFSDIKREILNTTGWWRRYMLGQNIFWVDPYDNSGLSARFSPMNEVRIGTINEIQDSYNLATAMVDSTGKGMEDGKDAVWKKRARDILSAFILHVLLAPEFEGRRSFETLIRYVTDNRKTYKEKLTEMLTAPHDPDGRYQWRAVDGTLIRTHPIVVSRVMQQLDRPEGEAGSVKSEAESYLSFYQDNLTSVNTATSDFSMLDVMDGEVPSSVYLCINPQNLVASMPFIRLFLNLLINRNMVDIKPDMVTGRQNVNHDWKCALMLDEFASFGKLDEFAKQLGYMAGYGFKPMMIWQTMQQVKDLYGQYETLTAGANTILTGSMNSQDEAEYFAKRLGKGTLWYHTHSASAHMGPSLSETSKEVEFISASDMAQRMSPKEAILHRSGYNPLPIEKMPYYDELSRLFDRAPVFDEPADRLPLYRQRVGKNREQEKQEYIEWCNAQSQQISSVMTNTYSRYESAIENIEHEREKTLEAALEENSVF